MTRDSSLCGGFYKQGSISAYFNTRLAVLAAVNEHREQFVAWADEGFDFHCLEITIPSVQADDGNEDPPSANTDPLQWYIQTETVSLQQHALETLLRLYMCLIDAHHWFDPLSAVTDRDNRLAELVDLHITKKTARSMRADVGYLLLGTPEVPDDDPERLAIVDNLVGIVEVLARAWLDGRRPYNAIKHGLLVSQSNASLRLGRTPDDLVDIGGGPSVAYLNHTNWASPAAEGDDGGKTRRWTIETRWIMFDQASKIIAAACALIESLWSLAVARWSQDGTDDVRFAYLDPDKINPRMPLTSDTGPGGQQMSWGLFTETKAG